MKNGGGAADDQDSGWLEVRKKHRSSSKLLIQKVSGGSSNNTPSYSPHHESSKITDVGTLHSRQVHPAKAGVGFAAQSKMSPDGLGSSSEAADHGNECLEKVVVDQGNGSLKLPPSASSEVSCSEGRNTRISEIAIKENLAEVPKIKLGDLEDVSLVLPEGSGDSVKIVKTDNGCMHRHPDCDVSVLHVSPCTPLQEGEVTSHGIELFPNRTLTSDPLETPLEGTWKEVCEIPSGELGLHVANPKDALECFKRIHDNVAARITSNEPKVGLDTNDATIGNCPSLLSDGISSRKSAVEGTVKMNPQELHDKSEDGALNVSEVSVITDNADSYAGLQASILPPYQNNVDEISVDASVTESMEDRRELHDQSTVEADTGEGDHGESKERFRERLWCFLFENLNRAVDELYLLCELECDKEQMNEAILVLDEAVSDFKELNSRVEHFENTKRSTSQSPKDGMPINAKTDNRRPHALSWEVRRMTTSPHRAEILSSSLEAFKKMQLERARKYGTRDAKDLSNSLSTSQHNSRSSPRANNLLPKTREPSTNSEKQRVISDAGMGNNKSEKLNMSSNRQTRAGLMQNGRLPAQSLSASATGKPRREPLEPISETEKYSSRKDKISAEGKLSKAMDTVRRHNSLVDREKEKEKETRNTAQWKPSDAWKEKRNWEDILKSPLRTSSRASHSPGLARRGMDRGRVLHDKLMSPEKKKKTAVDMKREAEEKHARAMRIRSQLENERVQKLQRTSEKLNRVNEWQAVRSLKLREGMHARHQRSESRHEAHLAQVVRRAGDESSKVNEVRFITSLNEENKKLILRQKLQDSEMRRSEKLQVIRSKQKEDTAREEAVLERRKLLEAEKLQRLAETQRKKEEAHVRREEERRASSAAREAKALEQLRKKEVRAKAQQEEAELLAQKLAERLSESEQRRKFYLEQIRERASMDFRDQSSPLLRRSLNKEGPSRPMPINSVEDYQASYLSNAGDSARGVGNATQQQSLKRRIKKIRQRLMALKYEFTEPAVSAENAGIGYRALVGSARVKLARWLQDLQKLRQARKEGATSIGLIVGEMIKFLEGKDLELNAARQAGLLDFISSALPASHTSKPEAFKVTVYLLRLLRVVLSVPANRSYFLVQNLLPPIIPMLSASLENYIKIAASSGPGSSILLSSKISTENLESIAEVLDGFLWTVTIIIGHAHLDERQHQMQDGLMELIVVYQIIHHLRDLFALYDRPQVEGSPFPSSILLSLNLLAVLASRSKTICSIDWEACISKAALGHKAQESNYLGTLVQENAETQGMAESMTDNCSGHLVADLSANESDTIFGEEKLHSNGLSLPAMSDRRPLDVECRKDSNFVKGIGNVEATNHTETTSDEVQKTLVEEHAKSPSPPKHGKSSTDGFIESKRISEGMVRGNIESRKDCRLKQPIMFLLSAIAETGLVGLPSLLTAVLLQANNRLSSEQASYILPSNFEEVATGVLKVLNNLALLDITLLQGMLARPDLKMEFFHLMSFLLSYCTSKWKAANDQVGFLLLESLLLLGYFALFHPGNQAVLRWGKSPTILHKVCDLPFVFFSDPDLTPILATTLVAACYSCDQNRGVVLQELSSEMLLSLIKSCRQGLLPVHSDTLQPDSSMLTDPCDDIQPVLEVRKPQCDGPLRSSRRTVRLVLGKGGVSGSNLRINKAKAQREGRGTKTCDEWAFKHNLPASEAPHNFMLHQRLPTTFLDKAEEFFAADSSDLPI